MTAWSIVLGAAFATAMGFAASALDLDGLPLRQTIPDAAGDTESSPDGRAAGTPSRDCGTRDALFAAGAQKVWVTRVGTARWHNPLRPVAPETLRVVQVAVNGRAGSAFGPDFDNLRQGDAAAALDGIDATRWSAALGEVPAELRVVSDDGRVLLGPLAFVSCGDAPKVARATPRPDRRPARDAEPRGDDAGPVPNAEPARPARREAVPRAPALPIPQGAIR